MGQKIHPNGLRIGINRKWAGNWFAAGKEYKNLFFYQKQIEDFFKAFFHLYSYTKISTTKRLLIVDLKMFKYNTRHLFLFIFFYKFRTKRRKEFITIQKKNIKPLKYSRIFTKNPITKFFSKN